jgi:sentrin-specific protease 1
MNTDSDSFYSINPSNKVTESEQLDKSWIDEDIPFPIINDGNVWDSGSHSSDNLSITESKQLEKKWIDEDTPFPITNDGYDTETESSETETTEIEPPPDDIPAEPFALSFQAKDSLQFVTHVEFNNWLLELQNKYAVKLSIDKSDKQVSLSYPYRRIVFICSSCKKAGRPCDMRVMYKLVSGIIEVKYNVGAHVGKYLISINISYFDSTKLDLYNPHIASTGTIQSNTVKYQYQIDPKEKEIIELLASVRVGIPLIKLTLFKVSGKTFHTDLINRISQKVRKGGDSQITNLYQLGERVKLSGGKFVVNESNMRINAVFVQHSLEAKLSSTYGKELFFLDGTHNVTKYVLRAIPPISIDCFGFTCPMGMALVEAEDHESVSNVLSIFSLTHPGSVAITDRALAWELPMKEAGIVHFYDTWHFKRDIQTRVTNNIVQYRKDMNYAIDHIFPSEQLLLDHLDDIDRYATDTGKKLLLFLKENYRKLALTFTTRAFIGSTTGSSSRCEGFMGKLKGNGLLKTSMREWNLKDFFEHHEMLVKGYVSRVENTLLKMEKGKDPFTPYVSKNFSSVLKESTFLSIVDSFNTEDKHCFFVCDRKKDIYEVKIPKKVSEYPTCSCTHYSSLLLPCRHIAKAFSVDVGNHRLFYSDDTLHPRWHVKNHPMYANPIQRLFPGPVPTNPTDNNNHASFPIDLKDVYKIPFPKADLARRSVLNSKANKLIDHATNDIFYYKLVAHILHKLLESKQTLEKNLTSVNKEEVLLPLTRKSLKKRVIPGPRLVTKRSKATEIPETQKGEKSSHDDGRNRSHDPVQARVTLSLSGEVEGTSNVVSRQESIPNECLVRLSTLLIPLSGPDKDKVALAWKGSWERLRPSSWIDDKAIDGYMRILSCRDQNNHMNNHYFSCFFFSCLLQENNCYNFERVQRWSTDVNIFSLNKLFIPVNLNRSHWALIVVFFTEKSIRYYDSLHLNGNSYLNASFRYLKEEYEAKYCVENTEWEQWTLESPRNIPKQENFDDCGIFTLMFADFISRDWPLVFNQSHIDHFRSRVTLSLLTNQVV